MIAEFGKIISRKPEVLVVPLYIGLLILSFAGLSYIIAVILKKPTSETLWLEKAMNTSGTVLIIFGVLGFFIAASRDSSISELRQFGVAGGVLLLLFHLKVGLLCIGAASLHNKYNTGGIANSTEESSKVVYCTSCGKQVKFEAGDEMCYHCGEPL